MRCAACGGELPDGAAICPQCGHAAEGEPRADSATEQNEAGTAQERPLRPPARGVLAVVVLGAFVVAGLAAYLLARPVRDALGIPVARAWAVGTSSQGGVVIDTADAWQTWNAPFATLNNSLFAITFASPEEGFAVGVSSKHQPVIFGSRDGGHNWVVEKVPAGPYGLYGVAFTDPKHGYSVGAGASGGVVLATADGGRTWKAMAHLSSTQALGIAFSAPSHGWIAGRSSSGRAVILGTTDGGRTWRTAYTGGNYTLVGVRFSGPSDGWAVGYGQGYSGIVLGTHNGGRTWRVMYATKKEALFSLSAVGSSQVWVSGMGHSPRGFLAHSADGGRTWQTQYDRGQYGFLAVSFRTPKDGYAIGSSASSQSLALTTTDGGRTWKTHVVSVPGNTFWGIY